MGAFERSPSLSASVALPGLDRGATGQRREGDEEEDQAGGATHERLQGLPHEGAGLRVP